MNSQAHKRHRGISALSWIVGISFSLLAAFFITSQVVPAFFPVKYVSLAESEAQTAAATTSPLLAAASTTEPVRVVTHVKTPVPLKAIYMSGWVAGSPQIRTNLVKLIEDTELNAVVIDIKDYSGRISFLTDDDVINAEGSPERRIADVKEFIDFLHSKNIYVIGRLSAFQDAHMVVKHPEWAVRRSSDGGVWKDYKGISWIDVSAKPFWDYLIQIAKYSYYDVGFDEINFDYIRFPSDGNMKDIAYPFSEGKKKHEALRGFFEYVNDELRPGLGTTTAPIDNEKLGKDYPVISADLFGMTTSNRDDLNIGQVLEDALPYFDYIAPMVYPSHYPATFNGYANPAAQPYEVIEYAMSRAVERTVAAGNAPSKMRPWLQDFSIGNTKYTPEMVRAQIQATYDVGLDSWMLWSAANKYSASALLPE